MRSIQHAGASAQIYYVRHTELRKVVSILDCVVSGFMYCQLNSDQFSPYGESSLLHPVTVTLL